MNAIADAEVAAVAPEVPEDLQVRASDSVLKPFTVDTLAERIALIQEAKDRCMSEGVHYGTVPGVGKKPSLWKSGAEVLCILFQLGQRYRVQERLLEGNHILYTVTCTQFFRPAGVRSVIAEGMGCCTSMEYKYRVQTEPKTYDNANTVPAKYTPFDYYNNCLKIAVKRALVSCTLDATGASHVFTCDLEDDPERYKDEDGQPPARKPAPRQQPTNGHHRAPATLERVQGVVSRVWHNEYQGKHYWFAKLDKGQQLQTTDTELGARLLKFGAGHAITVMAEPSPKPGKWYLKSIDTVPAAVENPNADRIARRQAAKARHEGHGKAPDSMTLPDDLEMGNGDYEATP
jgi:hypothetical protein